MGTTTYRWAGDDRQQLLFVPRGDGFLSLEVDPGEEFEADDGFAHVRVERKARNGKWTATLAPDAEPEYVEPATFDEGGELGGLTQAVNDTGEPIVVDSVPAEHEE